MAIDCLQKIVRSFIFLLSSAILFSHVDGSFAAANIDSKQRVQEDSTKIQMPETDIALFEVVRLNHNDLSKQQETLSGAFFSVYQKPLVTAPGYDNQPKFLDESELLYTAQVGSQTDIMQINIVNRNKRQVTKTPVSEYSPTPLKLKSNDSRSQNGYKFSSVVADGEQQTLWQFTDAGTKEERLDNGIEPVGYHLWIGSEHLALFRVAEPSELILIKRDDKTQKLIGQNVGRCLVAKNSSQFFFVRKEGESNRLYLFDVQTETEQFWTKLPTGIEDFNYHPKLGLISSNGRQLVRFDANKKQWTAFSEQSQVNNISRIDISPSGQWVAVVHSSK